MMRSMTRAGARAARADIARREDSLPFSGIVEVAVTQDWESIYRDNVDRIYRLMFARVGNRPDAEDLTAEVFKAALPPLRLSASPPEIRGYLTTTAPHGIGSPLEGPIRDRSYDLGARHRA